MRMLATIGVVRSPAAPLASLPMRATRRHGAAQHHGGAARFERFPPIGRTGRAEPGSVRVRTDSA